MRPDPALRHVRNGLLRAAPRTLQEIARQGQAPFPHFAYMPHTPAGATAAQPGLLADGAAVALEDGFPHKPKLSDADLIFAMHDLLALEEPQRVLS